MSKPKPFETKALAEEAAKTRALAGAVWVGPLDAIMEDVESGWYVGFPPNITKELFGTEDKF